ncbi:hypothetical protein LQ564_11205 [Massilia sp. G4R7]|uniref:Uncharacterized protein n=1 Tax=Massilia phyllostachyos TaxID=2898585 RepID=A0ABS8Q5P0_9BURK|nr:hypothetical protein [Massilia phyllostachyos]MCD2516873.1 hypothetical protein [Massilia phyllostachyos]
MTLEISALLPAAVTFAAALVAGGIARSTLIASKEVKVSEFRQKWIDSLRDELAGLFSNVRTLTRAMEEKRSEFSDSAFHFDQAKFTEARHGTAETLHKVKLRLNPNQENHKELLRRLEIMMVSTQDYLEGKKNDADAAIEKLESALAFAQTVLKSEWHTVKAGENEYHNAVKTTTYVLIVAGTLWALVVLALPVVNLIVQINYAPRTLNTPTVHENHSTATVPKQDHRGQYAK